MRKLVLFLSVAMAVLGASTVWLAVRLHQAPGALAAQAPPASRSKNPPITNMVVPIAAVPPSPPAESMRPADNVSHEVALSIYSPEQRKRSRDFLEKYRDPAGREELVADRRQMLRPLYADLGRSIGLSRERADQLIELLVQRQLTSEEAAAKCLSEPGCNYSGIPEDLARAQEREISEQFGAETLEQLRFFEQSVNQRQTVTMLRGRLPDSARLSDAKASDLVQALVDEDALIQKDMERVGDGIAYSDGAYVEAQADPTGARSAAVREYNRRLLDRAANILSAEQLAIFQQLIDAAVERGP